MRQNRKDYYRVILNKPINLQKPLPILQTDPSLQPNDSFSNYDLINRFH